MRDIVLASILLIGTLWALKNPYVGILLWTWISIMNPHRQSWELHNLPVAAIVGGATLIGLFLTRDRRHFFMAAPSAMLLLFTLWICVTFMFSFYPEQSVPMLVRVLKINLMIFVVMMLLYTRKHITMLAWVLVGSLGFYGVKGGIFTIASGGNHRVWGPSDSFIAGNNEVALALIMIIPLMYFLRTQYERPWIRHAFLLAMILTAVAAVGSQSRGALLAIVAMSALLWTRVQQKGLFAVLIIVVGIALIAFMPESWHNRMDTISKYSEDNSAMGRINAWHMTWNLACDRFFGGGFSIYNSATFQAYAPLPDDIHAAHSIYFQALGEHGFVGLTLFLLIWIFTWRSAGWLRLNAKSNDETEWAAVLGAMVQVSLVGYAVGGAFLSLAYFDLPYNMLVLVVLARRWVEHYQAGENFDEPELSTAAKVINLENSRKSTLSGKSA
ncbi:MAG: putative O-glycosylation ligase, exosortase A system-associated [Nitrosomonadales bacterium]|nr:putative O-glycosylation ligase, exosortase A system-associated [Nitrosomonadales bacterium]